MENNYENLRMPELKALAREHRFRGYSRLRKADLIAFSRIMNIKQEARGKSRPRDLHHHPHRGAQHLLHGCLPPGCPQGVLLGNHKLKPDNLN